MSTLNPTLVSLTELVFNAELTEDDVSYFEEFNEIEERHYQEEKSDLDYYYNNLSDSFNNYQE